jgi:hypothetical protein
MGDSTRSSTSHPVVYCDTIQSAGLHNGNVRLLLTRFQVDGTVVPSLELILPASQVRALSDLFDSSISQAFRESVELASLSW